jgi:hypothetical protein
MTATHTFIRTDIVADQYNVERVVIPATKNPSNPVLIPDRPWEGMNARLYGTAIYDDEEDLFKMWYISNHYPDKQVYMMYATSRDGLNWVKPNLGIVDYKGSRANNIFSPGKEWGVHQPSVVKHPDSPADRRYALFAHANGRGPFGRGLLLFHSPDGVRWTPHAKNPVAEGHAEVWNVTWDESTETYLATGKVPTESGRSVGVSISPDGVIWEPENHLILKGGDRDHWIGITRAAGLWYNPPHRNVPELDEVRQPSEHDQHAGQIYGMPAFRYADVYLAFPWAYHSDALMEPQLAWSTDRINWVRDPQRTCLIERGRQGSFDSKMIMGTATHPVTVGNELWLYYGGWDVRHHYPVSDENPWKGAAIGLARWRLDGFVAMVNVSGNQPTLVTSGKPGWVRTRSLKVAGSHLLVNADATLGTIDVDVCDPETGKALPGYSKEECLSVRHDSLRAEILWTGGNLERLVGEEIALNFHINNASLYSFSFLAN